MRRPSLPLPPAPGGLRRLPGRARRALALWLFLVALFFAFFLWFSAHSGDAASRDLQRALAWAPLLFVALFAFFYLRARRAMRRNQAGVDRLAAGDLDGAATAFRALARGGPFAATGSFNLGMTLLRAADVRGALAAFAGAERGAGRRGRGLLAASVAASVSLCDALLGELEAAEAWATEARARLTRPGHPTRLHVVAEAIVLARRGQEQAAARHLAGGWGEIELTTSADLMRGVRLVRAFLVERAGGSAGEVESLFAGARPFRKGEYAWVYGAWTELESWAAVKGFATA